MQRVCVGLLYWYLIRQRSWGSVYLLSSAVPPTLLTLDDGSHHCDPRSHSGSHGEASRSTTQCSESVEPTQKPGVRSVSIKGQKGGQSKGERGVPGIVIV